MSAQAARKVKQGTRMNMPLGGENVILSSNDAGSFTVSEETNRRWLKEEIQSCREEQASVGRRLREVEEELEAVERERERFERELEEA